LFASIILYSLGNIANGFVQTVNQYAIIRFITGLGLAGELGASITLVSELLPKEKRGIGASLVAGIGLTGAVFAFFLKENFNWRICYFIGGGLGCLLLLLRVGVLESGMFTNIKESNVQKGNFFALFTNGEKFKKYICSILIGLPTWYVIGILISFSDKFGKEMNIQGGAIDPGKAVMFAYVAISVGDVLAGFISQWFKSRKKAVYLFYAITAVSMIGYFNLESKSVDSLYVVAAMLGFGTGFWAIFVTMAAEQFGTNIRATVTTTVPNMVRGSLILVSLLFTSMIPSLGYFKSGWVTGIVVMIIALISLFFTDETYHKDLNYVES
jgi:MFS family permease